MNDPFAPFDWRLAHGRSLRLGPEGLLMGIVNVTPDSFSDGGQFASPGEAVAQALRMVEEGAAIVDIGGESTRPGAAAVSPEEELSRVLPVIAELCEALGDDRTVMISIDTYRASTARIAIEAGADIVNDVWGLQRDPELAHVVAAAGAGICIMHTGRERGVLPDPIADQRVFLDRSIEIARRAGISNHAIVLDPGFGFAKETPGINFELMARFRELHAFGLPLLAGTSRKRFLGAATGREAAERDAATAATTAVLRLAGAAIFRVHNVAINKDALAVADAMIAAGYDPGITN